MVLELKLSSVNQVYSLVDIVTAYDGDATLVSGNDKADARSLLGIFGLDLRHPLTLEINNCSDPEGLKKALDGFIIQK